MKILKCIVVILMVRFYFICILNDKDLNFNFFLEMEGCFIFLEIDFIIFKFFNFVESL